MVESTFLTLVSSFLIVQHKPYVVLYNKVINNVCQTNGFIESKLLSHSSEQL